MHQQNRTLPFLSVINVQQSSNKYQTSTNQVIVYLYNNNTFKWKKKKKTAVAFSIGRRNVGGGKELQIADPECIESLRCDSESNITTSHLQMHLWGTAAFLYAEENV